MFHFWNRSFSQINIHPFISLIPLSFNCLIFNDKVSFDKIKEDNEVNMFSGLMLALTNISILAASASFDIENIFGYLTKKSAVIWGLICEIILFKLHQLTSNRLSLQTLNLSLNI